MQDVWNHPSAPEAFGYCWARNNGEFYYGIHTGTPDDGYIGSGVVFRSKYDNADKSEWKRTIEFRGSTSECLDWETEVVTQELIDQSLCLNVCLGGGEAAQASNAGKLGGKASNWSHRPENHIYASKLGGKWAVESGQLEHNRRIVKCPHCSKEGSNVVMKRWHFDNCKEKS